MQLESKVSAAEAVLFACGEPIEAQKLAEAVGAEPQIIDKLVVMLNDRYNSMGSALTVLKLDGSYQLSTRKEYAENIKTALEARKAAALTSAAMETLTIVAYNQPVTKGFVEDVRGVDSSSIINSLVEKELLEEAGRLDVPGRPVLYRTTPNFLRCFQISSLQELPPLPNKNEQISFNDLTYGQEQT